jgi:hypothetical protein
MQRSQGSANAVHDRGGNAQRLGPGVGLLAAHSDKRRLVRGQLLIGTDEPVTGRQDAQIDLDAGFLPRRTDPSHQTLVLQARVKVFGWGRRSPRAASRARTCASPWRKSSSVSWSGLDTDFSPVQEVITRIRISRTASGST